MNPPAGGGRIHPRKMRALREPARPFSQDLGRLIASVADGNEAALASLYDATSPRVYGLVLRIVGDRDLAQEVTLDVYHQAWREARRFATERGSPETWLLTIARSRAIDRLRSVEPRRRREVAFADSFDPAGPADEPAVSGEREEDRRQVRSAIAQLPQEQRRAIELAFFQGFTHREISERLGEPLGTVKTRVRLGMLKLRTLLEPNEADL